MIWVEWRTDTLVGRWILRGGGVTTREDRGLGRLALGLMGLDETGLIGREGLPISLWELRLGRVIMASGRSTTTETRRLLFPLLPLNVLLLELPRRAAMAPPSACENRSRSLEKSVREESRFCCCCCFFCCCCWCGKDRRRVSSTSSPELLCPLVTTVSGETASARSITAPKLA
jgi:hypothetical protein